MSYFSRFSPVLTSYDFLKLFAVVTMIFDHVGFYFYPDEQWLRVVGRMSFPCWMFLIGYARTRDIPKSFIVGGLLLTLANISFSNYILPVTLFATFIMARLVLDRLARVVFRSVESAATSFWSLLVLAVPTYMVFEYGTLAFLMGLFGYAVRHRDDIKLGPRFLPVFSAAIFTGYVVVECLFFGWFGGIYPVALALVVFIVGAVLYRFKPIEFPELTARMPSVPKWILQFCGRYSLEIYVGHVILFIAVSKFMNPEGFDWFMPTLFP